MKVLFIVILVLFLIGCIPVGVLFRYHEEIELKLTVLFFKIGILPRKPLPRKKQEKADAKKAAKAAKKAEAKEKQKKKKQAQSLVVKPEPEKPAKPPKPLKDKVLELIPWAKLGARFVGEFFQVRDFLWFGDDGDLVGAGLERGLDLAVDVDGQVALRIGLDGDGLLPLSGGGDDIAFLLLGDEAGRSQQTEQEK